MKILFGGSFNPPTNAHLEVYNRLNSMFDIEEFVFLPTANVYNKPELAPIIDRINMLNLVCKKLENAFVSDFEANMTEYKGTSFTLKHFPDFYFLMGADNFDYIDKWIDYPNLIIDNKFIIIPRDGINLEFKFENDEYLKKYRDNFIVLKDFEEIDLSSSMFRKSLDKMLVPSEVYEYIVRNNLYED